MSCKNTKSVLLIKGTHYQYHLTSYHVYELGMSEVYVLIGVGLTRGTYILTYESCIVQLNLLLQVD